MFAGRPDVIASYSPPLPLGLTACLLSRIFHVPWLLQLEDLYPDAAIAAGVMTNIKVINFFLGMEKFLISKCPAHLGYLEEFSAGLARKRNSKFKD